MKTYSLIFFLLFSCKGVQTKNKSDICFADKFSEKVEEILLSDIDGIKKLNGKFVKLTGIFHFSFEDVAIYPSENANASQAMWLNTKLPPTIQSKQLQQLDYKKVTVIGKVNIESKGHDNAYFATLDSTFCIRMN